MTVDLIERRMHLDSCPLIHIIGAGEMVQRLRALIAFLEDLSNSQHSFGSSQLFVTLVSGDPTTSQGHTCRQKSSVHKNKNKEKKILQGDGGTCF